MIICSVCGATGYHKTWCPTTTRTDRNDMNENQAVTNEKYNYGRLWPDGTFDGHGWHNETAARRDFNEKEYELKLVPKSLRPVFARQRVVITTETYPAEALPEATK